MKRMAVLLMTLVFLAVFGCATSPVSSDNSVVNSSAYDALLPHEKEWLDQHNVDVVEYDDLLAMGYSGCFDLQKLTAAELDYLFPIETLDDRLREFWGDEYRHEMETTTVKAMVSSVVHIQELNANYEKLERERGIYPHEADALMNMSISFDELFTEPLERLVRLLLLDTDHDLTEAETLERLGYTPEQAGRLSQEEKNYIFPVEKLRDKLTADGFDPDTIFAIRTACPTVISYRQIIDLAHSSR